MQVQADLSIVREDGDSLNLRKLQILCQVRCNEQNLWILQMLNALAQGLVIKRSWHQKEE